MSGKKKRRLAPSATPWDKKNEDALTAAQLLVRESHRSIYGFKHESFEGDIAFFNSFSRDSCPRCGSQKISKRSHDPKGLRRYSCRGCNKTFSPVTATIFEDRKLPIPAWVDFLLQVFSFDSMAQMTREDRRSDTTTPYWMAKLFAVLEGVQDSVVLTERAWIDETFWPVAAKDAIRKPDGKLPRGLSKNQICIGVGVDESRRSVFIQEGFGKTSKRRTWLAFGSHMAPNTKLIHDMEGAHDVLVANLALASEVYNAKLLKGIPDKQNPLDPVNRLCFLLKRFLSSHSGFDRADLQGYLNLFHIIMNPPEERMEKVALVLERAMTNPKTLRFRDFYNVNTS